MSDRNYVAMRAAARDSPQACLHAAATLDPMFNESYRMPLPSAANRKYVHMASYRGHTIATYKDPLDEPVYFVGQIPVFAVYFALDELGDPITPVETCFWSPFLAMAMVDQYVGMTESDRKLYWKKQGPWPMIHQNYNAQHQLPSLVDCMRTIAAEASDPDLDLLYGDASEYGRFVSASLTSALEVIPQTAAPKQNDTDTTTRSA